MGGHAKRHVGNIKDRDTDNTLRKDIAEEELEDEEYYFGGAFLNE